MPDEIKPTTPEEDGETPVTAPAEKMLSQGEVNRLMANLRSEHTKKLNALQSEYDTFKKSVEDKQKEADEKAKTEVEELRKDIPEPIVKLLDKMSPSEQLEWLKDPANATLLPVKKDIPRLPEARHQVGDGHLPISPI